MSQSPDTPGRFTSWSGTWTFDKNGNRTQRVINGTTTNYGYNAADGLCWVSPNTSASCTPPSGGYTLSYDANGNQSGLGYTPFNQFASYGSQTYAYGGTTNVQRLAVDSTSYTPSLISGQTTQHTCSCGTQKIVRDPAGKPIAWQTGGQSYYFVTDRQDSIVLLTDSTQSRAAEYGYAPYGELYFSGYYKAGDNAYRYHGAFIDLGTSGLYKMGARYYNESTGRFTQPDPSGQETNRYNYADSNPCTYSDPTGLAVDPFACAGTALLTVGATGGLVAGAAAPGLAAWAVWTLRGSAAATGLGGSFATLSVCTEYDIYASPAYGGI